MTQMTRLEKYVRTHPVAALLVLAWTYLWILTGLTTIFAVERENWSTALLAFDSTVAVVVIGVVGYNRMKPSSDKPPDPRDH